MRRLGVVLMSAVLATSACSNGEQESGDTGSGAAQVAPATPADDASGAATTMRVVLTGGPKPGAYEKVSAEPTCTVGYASEGAWGNAASDLEDKEGLIGIDLIVPRPEEARSGTTDFMMTVYLDDRLDPANQFLIDTKNGKGTGTVTIEDRGSTATVTARGRTAEGVEVDATITCKQIMRAG